MSRGLGSSDPSRIDVLARQRALLQLQLDDVEQQITLVRLQVGAMARTLDPRRRMSGDGVLGRISCDRQRDR